MSCVLEASYADAGTKRAERKEGRFLHIAECGVDVEIHPSFRMFGSMNPSDSDAVKRELSPALRGWFTEFYVDEMGGLKDLEQIVETWVGKSIFRQYSTDWRKLVLLYCRLREMEDQGSLADGTGATAHFSLRSLTRVLQFYLDMHSDFGHGLALFHGCSLCFLSQLGKDSRLVVEDLIGMQEFVPKAKLSQPMRLRSGGEVVVVEGFPVRKGPNEPAPNAKFVLSESRRDLLRVVARACTTGRFPVLLQGPTSSGKTSLVEYFASLTGNVYVRINNHEHTDLQEYLGMHVPDTSGNMSFVDGVLTEAVRRGFWIVLDELNNGTK